MRAPHYPQDTPAGTRAITGPRLSLLLVEDDRADALLVEELIADAGLHADVVWAESMAAAERTGRDRPDCVLLDMNLPDASGHRSTGPDHHRDPRCPSSC